MQEDKVVSPNAYVANDFVKPPDSKPHFSGAVTLRATEEVTSSGTSKTGKGLWRLQALEYPFQDKLLHRLPVDDAFPEDIFLLHKTLVEEVLLLLRHHWEYRQRKDARYR